MKKIKRCIFLGAVAVILIAAARFVLPSSVESAVGYSMKTSRCGILVVLDEISESSFIELDDAQMTAVSQTLSSLSIQRAFERGNVINHKNGFGWYDITFSDEDGQTFHPTIQVDSNGDIFIDCVKYEIVDEAKRMELLELLGAICGR